MMGIQPSEIEGMTFSKMEFYVQFEDIIHEARGDLVRRQKE